MDLIKREDAIKELAEYLMMDAQKEWAGTASEDIEDWKELAETVFDDIPSYEPKYEITADQVAQLLREGWTISEEPKKDGWIPCKDKMPTEYALYLVTTKAGRVKMDRYYPDLKAWGLNTRYGYEQTQYRAWQKMPEPWEGADDED